MCVCGHGEGDERVEREKEARNEQRADNHVKGLVYAAPTTTVH